MKWLLLLLDRQSKGQTDDRQQIWPVQKSVWPSAADTRRSRSLRASPLQTHKAVTSCCFSFPFVCSPILSCQSNGVGGTCVHLPSCRLDCLLIRLDRDPTTEFLFRNLPKVWRLMKQKYSCSLVMHPFREKCHKNINNFVSCIYDLQFSISTTSMTLSVSSSISSIIIQ